MVLLYVKGETFVVFKQCMRVCGIWPPDHHKTGSLVIFSVTLMLPIVHLITRLIDPLGKCPPYKPEERGTTVTSLNVVAVLHQFALRLCGGPMIPLIESVTKDWSSITDPTERDIMKFHDQTGSRFFCAEITFFLVYSIVQRVMGSSLYKWEEMTDQRIFCAFRDGSAWVYVMQVLNVTNQLFSTLTRKSGDILFWSLAMHLSGQFKILKRRFQDLLLMKNEQKSRKEFRRLVERHNQLLELSEKLENSFRVFTAIRILTFYFAICRSAFSLGVHISAGHFSATTYELVPCAVQLSNICVYYYIGDYLTECSEDIADVFIQCEWYAQSRESRTNYSIVIARCRKITILTTAKIYKLKLSNFKYVVQTLYSCVSCIVAITSRGKH